MLGFKRSLSVANGDGDPGTLSIADQFAAIMAHVCLEYDLEPDVLALAQDVLQALKARDKHWPQQPGTSSTEYIQEWPSIH
jgi:hypothetical protein